MRLPAALAPAALAITALAVGARPAQAGFDALKANLDAAEAQCRASRTRIDESRRLIDEALGLTARARPRDMEGRAVARQAESKARAALAKNQLAQERSCAQATNIRKDIDALPPGEEWVLPSYIRGSVAVDTGGGWAAWDGKTALKPGQRIRTGKDGDAVLEFPGGSRMHLGPGSEFKVEKEMSVFEKGRFYYWRAKEVAVDADLQRRKLNFRTGTAAIAVRGTKFALLVDPKGPSRLALLEGEVALMAAKGGKETVVHPGQQVEFKGGKVLRGPEPLDPDAFQGMGPQ